MKLKISRNVDEICYPYIYELSLKCDYEVLTDHMCRQVGSILAALPDEFSEIREELEALQPMIYHLNGSIRGKLAVREEDLIWLRDCYVRHKDSVSDILKTFVLPRGEAPIPQLNEASSEAKKAIRLMVRLHAEEQVQVPEVLHRFCNVLCNYYFILTIVINKARGLEELPFQSESYARIPYRQK
ncbi:ATP--cob(I)alamin adenosyltransferase [Pelagicoccus albus]|uniref:ATP--cob(I)alamin adenosyltransferase n=1 Tax=Pelagicoccus albus TaxID=415222 RepID=A0A7X1B6S0_9BACT|nr:ATP--cob(I)alamin adenosyltransferase [Pelagicoccus albus]MBC2606691.1 ATP--cob(I)alamin adenosyltransferase [Pelagicoccus albus]